MTDLRKLRLIIGIVVTIVLIVSVAAADLGRKIYNLNKKEVTRVPQLAKIESHQKPTEIIKDGVYKVEYENPLFYTKGNRLYKYQNGKEELIPTIGDGVGNFDYRLDKNELVYVSLTRQIARDGDEFAAETVYLKSLDGKAEDKEIFGMKKIKLPNHDGYLDINKVAYSPSGKKLAITTTNSLKVIEGNQTRSIFELSNEIVIHKPVYQLRKPLWSPSENFVILELVKTESVVQMLVNLTTGKTEELPYLDYGGGERVIGWLSEDKLAVLTDKGETGELYQVTRGKWSKERKMYPINQSDSLSFLQSVGQQDNYIYMMGTGEEKVKIIRLETATKRIENMGSISSFGRWYKIPKESKKMLLVAEKRLWLVDMLMGKMELVSEGKEEYMPEWFN
jgi:hypothetical protein